MEFSRDGDYDDNDAYDSVLTGFRLFQLAAASAQNVGEIYYSCASVVSPEP